VGLASPVIFLLFVYATVIAVKRRREDDGGLLLACFSAPILLFFLIPSLFNRVEGNWPSFSYIALSILGARVCFDEGREGARKTAVAGMALGAFMSVMIIFHALWPMPFVPPKQDAVNQMRGWRELAAKVGELSTRLAGTQAPPVFCHRYQEASALSFYTRDPGRFSVMPGARVSMYNIWNAPEIPIGGNALLLYSWGLKPTWQIRRSFGKITGPLRFPIIVHNRKIRMYDIYLCEGYLKAKYFPGKRL
jgi:hypothetical protein